MSDRMRRHHSAERKAELLRRHWVEKVPVSQVCEEGQVKPSVFYRWQRDLLAPISHPMSHLIWHFLSLRCDSYGGMSIVCADSPKAVR